MPNELTMQTTWGRDPLPAGGDGQLAYLLVDLTADATEAVNAPPPALNLALVLDHSGSMSGAKIQNLKEAVTRLIDQLGPQDTLSITVFDEKAKLLVPTQKVTDRAALQAQVAGLREAGGTQMSSGLQMGLNEARGGVGPGVVSRILLLTDGQTWGDAEQCVSLAAQAGQAGLPISAFGVGADEDWSVSLLDRVAQASGGTDDYIAQPAEMVTTFRKTVQTMQATVIQQANLVLQLATGVTARAVYRITPMITRLNNTQADAAGALTIALGDLGRDAPATVLFELTIPPRRPGQYRLARALVRYTSPGAGGEREANQDVVMTFVAGLPSSAGNARVMNLVEKATAFRLQTRALEEAEIGNIPAATRTLRSAATRLLNLGETDLAQQAEQEAQRLEQQGQMSPGGTKKLTFATRKLAVDDVAEATTAGAAAPAAPPPAAASAPPTPPVDGGSAAPAPDDVPAEPAAMASNTAAQEPAGSGAESGAALARPAREEIATQRIPPPVGADTVPTVPPQGEAGDLNAPTTPPGPDEEPPGPAAPGTPHGG